LTTATVLISKYPTISRYRDRDTERHDISISSLSYDMNPTQSPLCWWWNHSNRLELNTAKTEICGTCYRPHWELALTKSFQQPMSTSTMTSQWVTCHRPISACFAVLHQLQSVRWSFPGLFSSCWSHLLFWCGWITET